MDVDSLRNELENHLKRNPDEHAPSGFRDRFAATIEDLEAAEDDESKAELEAALKQIRAEAEAAANCACDPAEAQEAGPDEAKAEEPRSEPDAAAVAPAVQAVEPAAEELPEPSAAAPAEQASDPVVAEPVSGPMQRYGLILAAILVALVVAVYFYR
jgi:cobalamin biosynthesis Mg chelatase CobN